MRYIPSTCILIVFFLSAIALGPVIAQQNETGENKRVVITPSAGYTWEDFNWSIAGNLKGEDPNIYSELVWDNLQGPFGQLDVKWNIWKKLSVQFSLSKTIITSGSASDTDYQGDNRTDPNFQASLKSDKGNTSFILAGLSYDIIKNKKYQITTSLGYGINQQFLFLLFFDEGTGSDQNLNTTYTTHWKGPFISIEPAVKISDKIELKNRLNYHQINYEGVADWNLIDQFEHPVSFRHIAKGFGVENRIQLVLHIAPEISISIAGDYHYWLTGAGIDILYLANGDIIKTRLNNAERKGLRCRIGFNLNL